MEAWHITKWPDVAPGMTIDTASWTHSLYWTARLTGVYKKPPMQPSVATMINQVLSNLGIQTDAFDSIDDLITTGATAAENLKEYAFEHIRASEFPGRPSRMRCVYLWPSTIGDPIEAATRMDLLKTGTALLKVELLQPDRAHRADAALLNCNTLPPGQLEAAARRYWTGGTDDHIEVLYEGQFRILHVQPLSPPAQ